MVVLHFLPASRLVFAESILRFLPPVWGDRVLLNLVLNSLQAMQATPLERREVEIDAALAGGRLRISVANRGPGIAAELAE
ncbi:hypothetical protein os1_07990 [Comamonadaceae bacterium OS-1]|nr:hypothetical protein os1_07990 [Comamonadaceae bacterium OS-1]